MNSKPGNISGDELQNRQALHQKMTNKKQHAWASYGHIAALLEYQKLLTRQFNGG